MSGYGLAASPRAAVLAAPAPLALWRALILIAALALVAQQLPALPTIRIEPSRAGRPATLGAPARAASPVDTRAAPKTSPTVQAQLAALPLAFEANRGQAGDDLEFVARGRGYAFGLTPSKVVLALQRASAAGAAVVDGDVLDPSGRAVAGARVVSIELEGGRTDARGVPLGELPGTVNYLIGNDPAKWRTGIPTFERVRYDGVYPGIDVLYYGDQRELEFDLVVAAGADPSAIALKIDGADRIAVRGDGVMLGLPGGDLTLRAPHVYQDVEGARRAVHASYVLRGNGRVGLDLDAYDPTRALVIDPILAYSTYLGGSGADFGLAITVDAAGQAFVTGQTELGTFPTTTGAFDTTANGSTDLFVAKLNSPGSALLWSTYVGGSGADFGFGIAVDNNDSPYVTGRTSSTNFPTTAPVVQSTFGGATDAFVLKLQPDGASLIYSTYLGGSGQDEGRAIAVDFFGRAHVTGYTASANFPLASPIRGNPNGTIDAFVTKLNLDASAFVYSTYLGGDGPGSNETLSTVHGDYGNGIALDAQFNAYVAGSTDSLNFPTTTGAFRTSHQSVFNNDPSGFFDGFVTKLTPAGALVYSTFLGGARTDHAYAITVDWQGHAYVAGATASFNFPTANAFDPTYNLGGDAFLTKLNAAGSAALYSTYLGGSPQPGNSGFDEARGVAADVFGNAWVVGRTDSTNFPMASPIQGVKGGSLDAFVSHINTLSSGLGSLVFSTYLGGSGAEEGLGIGMGPGGNVFVTGWTSGTNFPTQDPLQAANAGFVDAFVAKITWNRLYGVESSSDGLSRINLSNNTSTFIGRLDPDITKVTTPIAMAVRPSDRKIFVWNNSAPDGALLTVDQCTGLGTLVNASTPAQGQLAALAFSPTGTLYGTDFDLFTIDTSTGVRTLVGSLGSGLRIGGADFDPISGQLYGVELTPGGSTTPPRLVTINTATGAATVVGPLTTDVGRIGSIVFLPSPKPGLWGRILGSAFGGLPGDILFDIAPSDGTVSSIRALTGGFPPQGLGFAAPCAIDATPPTWPPGAALSPFRVGPKLVGFSWPTAADNVGVASYKVFKNNVFLATVPGNVTHYRAGALTSNTTYTFRVEACDAAGNCAQNPSLTITTPIGLDNYTWSKASPLTSGAPVNEHLFLQGLSAWFKFSVKPDERVEVTLTNLPADYDLMLFKDLATAQIQPASFDDLKRLNAQLLDASLIDTSLIDTSLIDTSLIDTSLIDASLIDTSLIDASLIDASLIDASLIDASLIDTSLIDASLIDASLIDASLIDASLIDASLIDASLIDTSLIDASLIDTSLIHQASSAAARLRVLGRSANAGTASERITRFTFDQVGDFYVRVRGKSGVFSLAAPFQVQATVQVGLCEGIAPVTTPLGGTVLSGSAGGFQRLVLWDRSRIAGTTAQKDALGTKLETYRAAVGGVLVRVDQDSRVNAAHTQADGNVGCPFAQNLVAAEIKRIIESYRALNPIEDVVIIGPDSAIPFWRQADPPLASERGYEPPARPDSPSQAALSKGLFLSQDRYGARFDIERLNYSIPVQDIGVSRVIENAAEVSAQLDAYSLLLGGQVPLNSSALVTGYDFLTDFAQSVRQELVGGLGVGGIVDGTLIGDGWTTNDLRTKILGQRYDLLSLGGHFTAFSTIGPDYQPATKLRSTEVLNSAVNMEWAIVASPGCHAGYNVPDSDAIVVVAPDGTLLFVTPEPDWAQVAARKRFILISGTGYQIGETELIDYSERMYDEFWKQLRGVTGTGAISTSAALLAAKKAYRAAPLSDALHIKAMLEATHFGLPVKVNMPVKRPLPPSETPIVGATTPYASGPGTLLGLSHADPGTLFFTLPSNPVTVRLAGAVTDSTATYLSGGNGFVANTLEPVLPLELRNVSVVGQVLRGVGFRSGAYTDTPNVLPLTATPGTELGPAMVPFLSDVFYPVRPWGATALESLAGGPVRLFITPAQHRSQTPGSTLAIRRRLDSASFRLFYSANTGEAASAGAHAIESVSSSVVGAVASFTVVAGGDPRAGVQEVWITYTATSGPFAGQWQSQDLTTHLSSGPAAGRETWTGTLALGVQDPAEVLYFVQVANGLGIVSMTTNGGSYFRLGPPPAKAATALALVSPAGDQSKKFGESIAVSALLTSGGAPVTGALVTFDLDGLQVRATTSAGGLGDPPAGLASATLRLNRGPGLYALRALFGGSTSLRPSQSGAVGVTIAKQNAAITLGPASAAGQYSDPATPILVATLSEPARGLFLREETIYWVVNGPDASGTPRYFAAADITNPSGQAVLRIDAIPLPAGTYTVTAYFAGSIPQQTGPDLVVTHPLYLPATAIGSLAVSPETAALAYTGDTTIAAGSELNAAAMVTQAGLPADTQPGDITRAKVRFDLKNTSAVLLATQTNDVTATGQSSASFAGLATGVYTVDATVVGGFFTSPTLTTLIAVFDPTGGFVTGGGWIDSPAGACQLSAVCAGATGRASFGFVSKYLPGAATPSGQTQFQFKAGGLDFHSSSYDWLVVAGARAQYKGSGTINGAGDFSFMLTAIDGQVSGGGGLDKFRIKIWNKATGAVVYDNQIGSPDDAEPTIVIQGGSIVIHKG